MRVLRDAMPLPSPKALETMAGHAGVVGGVPGLAVAEIVLDQAQVVTAIGQIVAAGVAQRVGWTSPRPARRAAVATR